MFYSIITSPRNAEGMNEAAVSALNQRKSEMAMMDHGLVKVTKIQEWEPRDKEKEKERIQSVERK